VNLADVNITPGHVDPVVLWALAVVALILGVIGIIQSKSVTAWAVSVVAFALVLAWWP
jgi:hypothetical protein